MSDLFAEQAAIFSRFIFRGFFVSGCNQTFPSRNRLEFGVKIRRKPTGYRLASHRGQAAIVHESEQMLKRCTLTAYKFFCRHVAASSLFRHRSVRHIRPSASLHRSRQRASPRVAAARVPDDACRAAVRSPSASRIQGWCASSEVTTISPTSPGATGSPAGADDFNQREARKVKRS